MQLMSGCMTINHVIWISNNFPGVFSLPNLVTVGSIYLGDALYEDTVGNISDGTLSGISLPALTSAFEIQAVNLASVESINIPNLVSNGLGLTFSGLPNLKNYTFNPNYKGKYVNITNTGLNYISWQSPDNISDMRLVGNPNLTSVDFSPNTNITSLLIDCGGSSLAMESGYPMPRLSGPVSIHNLEIRYCDNSNGYWRAALEDLGSTSAGTVEIHHNAFTGLQISNMTTCDTFDIHDNGNLIEISMPALETTKEIYLMSNAQLEYINETLFPVLQNVSGTFDFDGYFKS
jgi:hypothetical protein